MMLELSKIRLKLDFQGPTLLPEWMGSVFRGGFGEYLRRISCPYAQTDCQRCTNARDCVYYFIFEREQAKRGHAPPTRPIIIVPPFFGRMLDRNDGCTIDVDVLLFGRFRDYLPQALFALKQFGSDGVGGLRRKGMNRFLIEQATCAVTGEQIYDGETVNLAKGGAFDISYTPNFEQDSLIVKFETPIILKSTLFPPTPYELLELVRSRVILFVNEYGDESHVEDFECSGSVTKMTGHLHSLKRRSRRGGATEFTGFTGSAEYHFDDISDSARWLLNVGLTLGAGPKSAFGCGFFHLLSDDKIQTKSASI
jgi:CRISPR/Cas system endoribonuclease Cas6 (RAMP superfamily)